MLNHFNLLTYHFKNALFKHRDWLCKCVRDRADYPSLSGTWQFTAHCRMNFINILYGGKARVQKRRVQVNIGHIQNSSGILNPALTADIII